MGVKCFIDINIGDPEAYARNEAAFKVAQAYFEQVAAPQVRWVHC